MIKLKPGLRTFCSSSTSVVIPDSVTSIGDHAFDGCSSLTSVYITDLEAWCNIKFSSNFLANPLCYANNLYLNGSLVKDLVIPDSVTSIGDHAFDGCSSLTSVTFEDIKNWSVVISSGKKKKMNVKNVSKNATNLTQNYCGNEWIKE